MRLEDFKKLGLERNIVIEYTSIDLEYSKATRLGYYEELIEELPEQWREGRPILPFIVVAHLKDKNGCGRDRKDIPLENILYVFPKGKSELV